MWQWLEWLIYAIGALSLLASILLYAAVIVAKWADRHEWQQQLKRWNDENKNHDDSIGK
jgi:hypothetical protein